MKLVIAVIQPTKLKAVQEALEDVQVTRMTVSDAQGLSPPLGVADAYRGIRTNPKLLRRVALEIVVNDDFVERAVETIHHVARSGSDGDGKIFVIPVDQAIRIGDQSRGPGAV